MINSVAAVIARSARQLAARLEELERRIVGGDETAWAEFRDTAVALAQVSAQTAPGQAGELLTTAQMAARLNLAPKTLLKRARRGELKPALQRGKLIRWRGDEAAAR